MKPGGGEGGGGGGGGGGGAAGIGMRPGAPLLVHSGPGRRLCHSRGRRRRRLLRGSSAARRPVPQGAGKGAGRAEREEHRASSHQCGPFKLQICLSSLYNNLLLHCHYREVHHMSGHRTESAGGHLLLPQDLRWKSPGLGVFAVQSVYELARRHNVSPFYSGPP
ncbi:zinc finger protein 282-like [Symphalangus syndactylus]|uniref:zinc finger protein 282-like n=1 Tax=Symphalangus syndactylus TaxID=9590 RepID=UPI00300509CD